MIPSRALLFMILFLSSASCSDRQTSMPDPIDQALSGGAVHYAINSRGDTVSTGVPISAKGKLIDEESIAPPTVVALQGQPAVKPVHTNRQPAGQPDMVSIPKNLTMVIPGKNGMPAPVLLPPRGKVVSVQYPRPVSSLPFRIKDIAACDIQYLDVDQGMISSYIRFLLKDRKGYLWFGTSHGVSRYDGNRFIHYTIDEGLPDNTVLCMLEDNQGHLWFGMRNGVSRYDGNQFVHYGQETGWPRLEFKTMLQDRQGNLWFGTGDGLISFDGRNFMYYTTREGLLHDNILSMLEDEDRNLWLGTSGGLMQFDFGGTGAITYYTKAEGLTHNIVSAMLEDGRGHLWFGTGDGANRYDGTSFAHFKATQGLIGKEVRSLLKDTRGDIWFGTNAGVSCYDGAYFTHYSRAEGLSNNEIRSILEDSQGNLWFGSGGGGVNRLDRNSFVHFSTHADLSDNGFLSILEDTKGYLWFGVGSGVIRYDGASFTYYTPREGLAGGEVRSILEDHRGHLWFGTSGGVSRFDGTTFTNYTTEQGLVDNVVRSMLEDRQGNLWFAAWNGVTRYQPDDSDKGIFTHFTVEEGLLSNRVKLVTLDQEGNIWFGSNLGASRYDPDRETLTHYTTADGLPANDIRAIVEDRRGNIWFGTGGSGISRWNLSTDGSFTHYSAEHGLSNNFIWSLLEDGEGNIWMSTEKGITLMRNPYGVLKSEPSGAQDRLPGAQFFTFQKEAGLKRLDFQANSAALDRQNRLWMGAVGLVMLDLNRFRLPAAPLSTIELNHIEINQQFVDYRKLAEEAYRSRFWFGDNLFHAIDSVVAYQNYPAAMRLPYKLNHLTFHFSAIDWAAPNKIQYEYFLKGLDQSWSTPSSEPRADYRNLRHGAYTFMVRAKGEAQMWSEPFSFSFYIIPPWWHTWWAYIAYALLGSAILYGAFSYQRKRWDLQNELKREQEQSVRLKELDALKTRLYTNLTHEFRTPLTIILGMTEQLQNNPKTERTSGLALIRQNGRHLLQLINQLLDLSKLENKSFRLQLQQGDIIPFLHYVTDSFYSYANSKNLSLQFFTTVEQLLMDHDPEQIKQILNNLLSNAIKFTPSGGKIVVRADRRQNDLQIEVADTGIGIAPAELTHIFDRFYQVDSSMTRKSEGTGIGLTHTQELVKLMGGEITVASQVGKGTTFKISLPIRTEADTPEITATELDGPEMEQNVNPILTALPSREMETDLTGPVADSDLPELLIIEDNPDVVTYLKTCLAGAYHLDVAFNGKIGIEKALESIPDIIISDIMMPEKNGFEVCETLKNDERTSHIPIILLTAKADKESRISGLKTGADDYLYKPFDEEELLVRLETLVRNREKLQAYLLRQFQHELTGSDPPADLAREDAFIARIRQIVEANYADEAFAVPELSRKMSMHRSQLYRKMKALIGIAPSDFIRKYRLLKAKELLKTTSLNVSEVAWKTGYKEVSHFSKSFLDEFGYSPSERG